MESAARLRRPFGDTRTQNNLEKMLTEFRRADCQIQAVDIGGLRALATEGRLNANGRESLFTMAKSTGGELFENYNDLAAAMGQMLRRTGVTYVLSFQPGDLKLDGEFHNLPFDLKPRRAGRGGQSLGILRAAAVQGARALRAPCRPHAVMGQEAVHRPPRCCAPCGNASAYVRVGGIRRRQPAQASTRRRCR